MRTSMTERGSQLLQAAEQQISELITLISQSDEAGLSRPCPGREKLGDGTLAAVAMHTADTYLRIAAFAAGHLTVTHTEPPGHDTGHRAQNIDPARLIERLSDARTALTLLADLPDEQLDRVPPAGETRFCDGNRTLEHVITSMLKHQAHQIDALRAVIP